MRQFVSVRMGGTDELGSPPRARSGVGSHTGDVAVHICTSWLPAAMAVPVTGLRWSTKARVLCTRVPSAVARRFRSGEKIREFKVPNFLLFFFLDKSEKAKEKGIISPPPDRAGGTLRKCPQQCTLTPYLSILLVGAGRVLRTSSKLA